MKLRREQPHFANARSIRNALDRARLRHANRVFKTQKGEVGADTLSKIEEEDQERQDSKLSRRQTLPTKKKVALTFSSFNVFKIKGVTFGVGPSSKVSHILF